MNRACGQCGREVPRSATLYQLTITLVAEPGPEFDLEMPADGLDSRAELESLIEKMAAMDSAAVDEANEQVHDEYKILLCAECRGPVHRQLKRWRALGGFD